MRIPNGAELRRLTVTLALSWLALALTIWIMPGVSADATVDVLAATAILGVLSALLRPLLTSLALLLGWVGVLLAGLCGQAALFYLALTVAPGIHVDGFWNAFWASWVYAFLMTRGHLGRDRRRQLRLPHPPRATLGAPSTTAKTETPGVVFIQIDGLPAPLLRWAVRSGELPTLGRWIRSGSHRLADWHAQLPGHHAGEPGRSAARPQRPGAGVPLVREGGRPAPGRQPSQGRRGRSSSASPTGAGCSPTVGSASPTSSPATRRPAC